MTVECLTFDETLEFCGPTDCSGCPGQSRVKCVNCPTNSKRYCYTKAISKKTGKQTAVITSLRRGRCCPFSGARSHCRKCRH